MPKIRIFVPAVLIAAGLAFSLDAAQFQNPIQAAKDAYKKSKEQSQQQKQPGQAQNQQSAPTQTASAAAPPAAPSAASSQNGAPSGDCCSADAMKKQAADASFLDVVGIKLGMSPEQATAAIRAYNASYKIVVVSSRLERPSNPNVLTRVPRYIFVQSPNMNAANGQVEHITIKFTTPPNPPVVQEVERYIQFQSGQPVLASNMIANLRQKYGQDNSFSPGDGPMWIYGPNGKLLTQVPNAAVACQPTGNVSSVIVQSDLTHDAQDGGLNLSDTAPDNPGQGLSAENCRGYFWVKTSGTGVTPNDKVVALLVSIRSGSLTYNSMKSTHDWLQSEADAVKKKQDSDAAGRSGPKL